MNVAPRGLPRWRRWSLGLSADWRWCGGLEREVLRRKSWVIAMPMEAKEREVRSQARNVRSVIPSQPFVPMSFHLSLWIMPCCYMRGLEDKDSCWRRRRLETETYPKLNDPALHSPYSPILHSHIFPRTRAIDSNLALRPRRLRAPLRLVDGYWLSTCGLLCPRLPPRDF